MAVLVESFSVVTRLAAIDDRYPNGWDGFCAERPNERICWDHDLVSVACRSRDELRAYLGRLAGRGLADAAAILATTELSSNVRMAEEVEAIREAQAAVRDVALVYRFQKRPPPWVEVLQAPLPAGGPLVAGCYLAGGPQGELAFPTGWTPQRAIDHYDEPGDGDEYLPTWHEFVATLSPQNREYMLAQGPSAIQAMLEATGQQKMFAGRVRPGGKVIEEVRIERDADGIERPVLHRWVKL